MSEVSRRDLLKRSATVAATATVASVVVGESSASAGTGAAAPAGRGRSFVGTVVRQDGSGLIVTAPEAHGGSVLVRPKDFPSNWVFRRGDKVTVMTGRPGRPQPAVPLVAGVTGTIQDFSTADGVESLTVEGTTVTVHAATSFADISPREAAARQDGWARADARAPNAPTANRSG